MLKSFRTPTDAHSPSFSPLPSLGYCISGKEVEVRDSGSQHHQLCCRHGVPTLPKPCDSPLGMAAAPGFKSQRQSSSAAPFPTPPTISYTCQHSLFFQLYWAAIVTLGRCGPMAWSQSSPTSHTGAITRGSCLPVTSWVEVTPSSLAQSRATAI